MFRAGSVLAEPASGAADAPSEVPQPLIPHTPPIGRDREARRLGWAVATRPPRTARRRVGHRVRRHGEDAHLLAEGALFATDDGARIDYVDFRLPGASLPARRRDEGRLALVSGGRRLDQASIADVDAIERIVRPGSLPALVALAMDTERAAADVVRAVHRLVDDDAVIRLGPLAIEDMRHIGELYVGGQADRIPGRRCSRPRVVCRTRHTKPWPTGHASEAAQRFDGYAAVTTSGRGGLRAAEAGLAGQHRRPAGRARARARVRAASPGATTSRRTRAWPASTSGDAEWFFGRERLVAEMVSRLAGATAARRRRARPGSGKSSAVRAGLVATLTSGVLPRGEDSDRRAHAPGGASAAGARPRDLGCAPEPVREHSRDGGRCSAPPEVLAGDPARARRRPVRGAVHDCTDEDERAAFIDALVDAATDDGRRRDGRSPSAPTSTAAARTYPDLAASSAANHVLVGAMSADELSPGHRAAGARGPAPASSRRSWTRSSRRFWASRARSRCSPRPSSSFGSTHRVDDHVPRARGAPAASRAPSPGWPRARTADLDEEQRPPCARACFLRLAGAGEGRLGRQAPRRRCAEFDTEHDRQLAEPDRPLARRRLITVDESSVEIIHEALLREWPRYQDWLEEDQQGRLVQAHLAVAAREWAERGRDSGELYRGARSPPRATGRHVTTPT